MHPPSIRASHAQTGLTLLELIIALAISALVALLGSAAMSNAVDFHGRGTARTQAREELRAVEHLLRHEWQARGQRVVSNGSQLEFDTLHPIALEATNIPTIARVRYVCERQESPGDEYILRHQILPPTPSGADPARPPPLSRPLEDQVMASHLRACDFAFLKDRSDAQGRIQRQWANTWSYTMPPPNLVRANLSDRNDMPELVFSLRAGGIP